MCSAVIAMMEKLELCLTDVVLKMQVVDDLLKVFKDKPAQGHATLEQEISQLRQCKRVKDLNILFPVCFSLIIILFEITVT